MLCETHKAPAVFFSNKEKRYVCFKCLVSMEKLQYIDKSYNNEMSEFERIKELTNKACHMNTKNMDIIRKWKYEVRKSLMKVKTRFNENLDLFIYDFCNLFQDVDQSNDLRPYKNEDKKIQNLVEELQRKYCEILKIFANITNSQANKRIQYIDNIKNYMRKIENRVNENNTYIKRRSKEVRDALDSCIALDSFESKIETKLVKFFNKECKKKYNITNMSRVDDTQIIFNDYQYAQ